MSFLIRWLFLGLCISATPYLVGGVHIDDVGTAIAAAAVLGILNLVLKPLLVLLTLPFTILTLGLFLLIINAVLFHFTAFFVSGLHVDSFFASVLAALWISLFGWIANLSLAKDQGRTRVVFHQRGSANQRPMRDVGPPSSR